MTIFLRVVCCCLGLTFAVAAYADETGLMISERKLQESYNAAVAIAKAQKPGTLADLQKEQEEWVAFRDKECKQATDENYCKANMNRKRANVLRGLPPSGKKPGASF